MTVVIDTSVFVDHLRATPRATDAVQSAVERGRVTASVVSRVELRRGRRPHQLRALERLDTFVEWIPVDHAIAALAARHAESFGCSHPTIDAADYVIGATAEQLGATLFTRNVRHFPMFEGLVAPY